ncbi:MAG TPA: MlaD family protein [Terriglobia bacterium]|nr:MlaD family protein [Terriglobia bacterium]
MPQRKEVRWAELRVGVMVAVGLIVFMVAIFLISGQIGFITSKYTLHVYFATASGLRPGSQVQLTGIPAGTVQAVRISDYHDPQRAVEIVLRVAREYQNEIRADSVANQSTAGLLGEAYLDISRGSPQQPVIPDGGVIKSSQGADIQQIEQNANDVVSNLRVLSASLNDITNQITQGKGSIGKLMYDETFYNQLNATVKSAQTIMASVQKGQGTIGALLVDPTAYNKLIATLDRLNQFVDQAQNGQGTLGRFMSDPAVYNQLKDLTAKVDTLVNNINQGQGTLGRLATDRQLYDRLNATAGHIEVVTARMEQGTGTLGKLSTDPSLYNNLSASSTSLKEFLTEFRKNPRKYLTLHLHIF